MKPSRSTTRRTSFLSALALSSTLCLSPISPSIAFATESTKIDNSPWPSWRGPTGNGVAPSGKYQSEWGQDKNIEWKVELPGRGASTPIIVDNQLIFTLGVEGKNTVWSLNMDGSKKWTKTFGNVSEGKHAKASEANSSPVTDGKDVFVYFKSGELASLDLNGETNWSLNLQELYGKDTLWWDLGTSPILSGDALIIAIMHSGPSYLVALNKKTGKELWKADRWLNVREESNQSYTTPTIAGDSILTLGADHVTAHDKANGQLLWKVGGMNPTNDGYFRSISSPLVVGDLVICPYARGNLITAVKLGKDIPDADRVAWKVAFGSDVPTPTTADGKLYVLGDKGLVTCLEASTGKTIWEEQLPKSNRTYSSSPVLADGKLYCLREDATCFVVDISGDKPEVLSKNELGGQAVATPVFYGDRIYLRTFDALYCIK